MAEIKCVASFLLNQILSLYFEINLNVSAKVTNFFCEFL